MNASPERSEENFDNFASEDLAEEPLDCKPDGFFNGVREILAESNSLGRG